MSSNELDKRYGLMTAIAMVVGVVIGSGVFFKADDVLRLTGGNLAIALLAWALGAFSMIFGALVFAEFAQRIEKSNGIVDYAEAAYGKMFGYLVGWFKGVLYYAPLSAILAWVAALYTMILLGSDNPTNSGATWILAAVYMTVTYLINFYAPALAGKLQVGSTLIKLIPLILVAIVGTISGLLNGVTVTNFVQAMDGIGSTGGTLATAVVATAFAYEGWIAAVTINSEIRDSKKNLPRALVIGTLIVFVVYVTYFLGIASVLPTDEIVAQGDNAVNLATTSLFGGTASTILTVFVIISCLGTLNGLVLATMRYSLLAGDPQSGACPQVDEPYRTASSHANQLGPRGSVVVGDLLSAVVLQHQRDIRSLHRPGRDADRADLWPLSVPLCLVHAHLYRVGLDKAVCDPDLCHPGRAHHSVWRYHQSQSGALSAGLCGGDSARVALLP
ncbi:APC family permease [Aeromonas veronii]